MSKNKKTKTRAVNKSPRWREFERLIARIHNQLYPNGVVQHNEHIVGVSGQKRQFDVTIRCKLGPHETLTVVDCKKHKAPVDIGYIEQFRVQANDVKADMAVIVSTSGFTRGAIAQATTLNVRLLTFEDASTFDWKNLFGKVRLKILDFNFVNQKYRLVLQTRNLGFDDQVVDAVAHSSRTLYAAPDMREIPIEDILKEQLEIIQAEARVPGEFFRTFTLHPGLFMRIDQGYLSVVAIKWLGTIVAYGYSGDVSIDSGAFLRKTPGDEATYAEITTKQIQAGKIPDGFARDELLSLDDIERFKHEHIETSEPTITLLVVQA